MTFKKTGVCANDVHHSPKYHRTAKHHVFPQMWGGKDKNPDGTSNLIELCPTCHDSVHVLLDIAIHLGDWPNWKIVRHFNSRVTKLAKEAWKRAPIARPPLTLLDEQEIALLTMEYLAVPRPR